MDTLAIFGLQFPIEPNRFRVVSKMVPHSLVSKTNRPIKP